MDNGFLDSSTVIPNLGFKEVKKLAEGGMGSVFLVKAKQLTLNLENPILNSISNLYQNSYYVIKCFPKSILDHDSTKERFLSEAKYSMNLAHENLVKTHYVGIHQEIPLIIMDYIPGPNLKTLVEQYVKFISKMIKGRLEVDNGLEDNIINTLDEMRHTTPLGTFIINEIKEEGGFQNLNDDNSIYRLLNDPKTLVSYCNEEPESAFLKKIAPTINMLWPRLFFQIMEDYLHGLNELHKNKIGHFDIKPQNIFVRYTGTSYLGDLGIASQSEIPPGGSVSFMSPEQVENYLDLAPNIEGKDKIKSDIYSSGIMLIWGLGKLPEELTKYDHSQKDPKKEFRFIFNYITKKNDDLKDYIQKLCDVGCFSDYFKHVMQACVSQNPTERPSVRTLIDAIREEKERILLRELYGVYNINIEELERHSPFQVDIPPGKHYSYDDLIKMFVNGVKTGAFDFKEWMENQRKIFGVSKDHISSLIYMLDLVPTYK